MTFVQKRIWWLTLSFLGSAGVLLMAGSTLEWAEWFTWALYPAFAMYAVLVARVSREARRLVREAGGLACPHCGYPCPAGKRLHICTECGQAYSLEDCDRLARDVERGLLRPHWESASLLVLLAVFAVLTVGVIVALILVVAGR